jgi:hypothetical protein
MLSHPESSPPRSRLTPVLTGVVIVAIAGSALVRLHDLDLFWHLATGRWIWEHRALPQHDPFSYASHDQWHVTEWLSQVIFHLADRTMGAAGVQLATCAAVLVWMTCAAALACASCGAVPRLLPLTLAIFGLSVSFRCQPKPEQASFVFFTLWLGLLAHVERSGRTRFLVWLPITSIVWGNAHRGGSLGLAALGLTSVVWLARAETRRLGGWLVAATAACAVGFTLNATGPQYLGVGARVTSFGMGLGSIAEWQPPNLAFFTHDDRAFSILVVCWLAGVAWHRRVDRELFLALAMCLPAARVVRFVPFAAIAMLPSAARLFDRVAQLVLLKSAERIRGGLFELAGAVGAIASVGFSYLSQAPSAIGFGILDWRVPVAAAEWIASHRPPGAMWNSFDYGGYLLYRLAPSYKVLIDGRNEQAYDADLYGDVVSAAYDGRVLERHLARWPIGFLVLQTGRLEDDRYAYVQRREDFRLVYLDDITSIWLRAAPEAGPLLNRFEYRELRPLDAMRRAAAIDRDPRGRELEQEIVRYAQEVPQSIRAHYLLALVHRARGRSAEYEAERATIANMLSDRDLGIALP